MVYKYKISIAKLIESFSLTPLYLPADPAELYIRSSDVNRPGLQFAGFFDVFDEHRTQIIGKSELTYLQNLDPAKAQERIASLFELKPPAVIISRGFEAPPGMVDAARRHGVPLLSTKDQTSSFMSSLILELSVDLAPRITRHGVLLEIFGEGVLLLGHSGIGKSETAVELIVRGHRLIADDAVEIRRISSKLLVGSSPDNIRHFMELRGIGVINARRLFGMKAVKMTSKIDLIIQLEQWNDDKVYDRLGTENEYMDILGLKIPALTIPVKPGRNLAVIVETATMNQRQKKMGYNPARELMKGLGMAAEDLPPIEKIITNDYWDF